MYSEQDAYEDMDALYRFLKRYGEEETLVFLRRRIEELEKPEGDL